MEKPELLTILRVLARRTKDQYSELLAHWMLVRRLKDQGILDREGYDIETLLENARQSPELKGKSAEYGKVPTPRFHHLAKNFWTRL